MSKMKMFRKQANELENLLGTGEAGKQAELVKALMRPIFTLVIQLDGRTGQVTLANAGAPIPGEVAHQMLDAARMTLARMQNQAEKSEGTGTRPDVTAEEEKG